MRARATYPGVIINIQITPRLTGVEDVRSLEVRIGLFCIAWGQTVLATYATWLLVVKFTNVYVSCKTSLKSVIICKW